MNQIDRILNNKKYSHKYAERCMCPECTERWGKAVLYAIEHPEKNVKKKSIKKKSKKK